MAGYLHQPPGPRDRAGGGRGARGRGLAGQSRPPLCCGLTWISTGQLATARRVLRRTVDSPGSVSPARRPGGRAGAELHRGVPVRRARADARRPRCAAAAAADRHAGRTAHRSHRRLAAAAPGRQGHRAGALPSARDHGLGRGPALLRAAGGRPGLLESGCCGLAGNFGFERGHYDVRVACAEQVLLPAVRDAAPDTLSCWPTGSAAAPRSSGRHRPHAGPPGRDTGRRAEGPARPAVPPAAPDAADSPGSPRPRRPWPAWVPVSVRRPGDGGGQCGAPAARRL